MKLAIVGNCQVQGLKTALAALDGLDIETVEVWNQDAAQIAALDPSSWDLILAQPLGDRYGPVGMSALNRHHRGKTHYFHVFHLQGLFPDCTYVGTLDQRLSGVLSSPMGQYHSRIILDAFKAGEPVEEAVRKLRQGDSSIDVKQSFEQSFARLRERESVMRFPLCDLLQEQVMTARRFWLVNHPTQELLGLHAAQMAADLFGQTLKPDPDATDTLKRIGIWPIYPWVRETLGLPYGGDNVFDNAGGRTLTFDQFAEESYRIYERHAGQIQALG